MSGAKIFDLNDMDNEAAEQLFNEVVGSLSAAFSNYVNDPTKGNRMSKIQGDQFGFAKILSRVVEEGYQWKASRGLELVKTAILAIDYDDDSKMLISDVKKADALSGNRGNSFFQQAAARGMQSAGENDCGANMAFMGMGVNVAGNIMEGVKQPDAGNSYHPNFRVEQINQNQTQEDPIEKLIKMKKLLDAGVITEDEFSKIKFNLLGL